MASGGFRYIDRLLLFVMLPKNQSLDADVAQLVEQLIRNQ